MKVVFLKSNKIIALLLIYFSTFFLFLPVFAEKKSEIKIGLALSGGGARGNAHIGVLKALEEMNIKVDYISGTSIGALIGGMYASGIPIEKIEELVKKIDWGSVFDDNPNFKALPVKRKNETKKYIHPFNLGIKDYSLKMPKGVVIGQKINFIIQSILLNGKQTNDFNKLPIPLRVVATDIATGKMVVISHGNLGKALRGSMSVPGVFAPVEYENYLLVDGGLTNNLPIKVLKDMGADIVIAVDISASLFNKQELTNVLSVTRQMIKIMMKKNTDEQLSYLSKNDILIVPNLNGMGSSDFDKLDEAKKYGYDATLKFKNKLSKYSISDNDFKKYLKKIKSKKNQNLFVKNIVVSDNTKLNPEFFLKRIKTRPGDKFDINQLQKDFESIYESGYFESVDFIFDSEKNLQVEVKDKSWGPNLIDLGVHFTDNFRGDNNLDFILSLTKSQLNSLGGELKFEFITGSKREFTSAWYQPLNIKNSSFFNLEINYVKENSNYLLENIIENNEIDYHKLKTSFFFGNNFKTWGQFKYGFSVISGSSNLFNSNQFLESYENILNYNFNDFKHFGYDIDFTVNTLDKAYLPTSGYSLNLSYFKTLDTFGLDSYMYDKYLIDFKKTFSFDKNTFLIKGVYGSSFKNDPPLYDGFYVSGLLGVANSNTGKIMGSHLFQTGLFYYYEITKIRSIYKFFVGSSFEMGNAWLSKDDINFSDLHHSETIFSALETPVGPVYLGLNYTEPYGASLFLSIGSIF